MHNKANPDGLDLGTVTPTSEEIAVKCGRIALASYGVA